MSNLTGMIERRYSTSPDVRKSLTATRTGAGVTISGYAAVFDKPSQVIAGSFRETIKPGAFRDVLAGRPDVAGLFNHDPSLILGRTSSGTMRLFEDRVGLRYEIDAADTDIANRVTTHVARRDIVGSSFAFRVAPGGDSWSDAASEHATRTIRRVERLVDCGPCTFAAYLDSTAEVDDDDSSQRGMPSLLRQRVELEEMEIELENDDRRAVQAERHATFGRMKRQLLEVSR